MAKILPSTGRVEYTDRSDRVFTSPRMVCFSEMECSIPRQAIPEALRRVQRLVDEPGIQLSLPVEVRVVAPDDIPLSTASGRASVATSPSTSTRARPTTRTSRASATSWVITAARPHWGKLHVLDASALAERYPWWDDFQAIRRRVDPEGRFSNPYLARVLG